MGAFLYFHVLRMLLQLFFLLSRKKQTVDNLFERVPLTFDLFASIVISQMTNYLQCRRLVESFGNAVTFITFYFFAMQGSYIHQDDLSLE